VLFRSSSFKVVAGGGYFDVDTNGTTSFGITDPDFASTTITVSDTQIKHTNLYGYGYLSLPAELTLTVGVSGDLFDQSGTATSSTAFPGVPAEEPMPIPAAVLGNKDQANPKLGLAWNLKSGTTLRGAWFRTLKRTLVTDQTLEPTQVAGFNQFFDDATATETWVYGGAIDQKFGSRVFGGVEYSGRDLTIPYTEFRPDTGPTVLDTDGKEKVFRAYALAAPYEVLTFSAEYQYEDLTRNADLALPYQKVKTSRVPMSVRYFHRSGFSAFVQATYLKQDGQFLTFDEMGNNVYIPGQKDFWVVDAALRYRLPRRYGFLVAGVNNLTDEKSTYQATDARNLSITPGRVVYGRVVLAFP
jgi:hypothetical protein